MNIFTLDWALLFCATLVEVSSLCSSVADHVVLKDSEATPGQALDFVDCGRPQQGMNQL